MAIFGISDYGTDVYGLSLPPAYLVDPMVAVPIDYGTLSVTWKQPSGTIFRYRMLSNRYGFPVDENDGNIIYDSGTYPGSAYVDTSVIPGTYHYYGFYVLADVADNIWIRSGFAACLAPQDNGTADWLYQNLPEYFRTQDNGDELTATASGNTQLEQFFNVLGWAGDYLWTQYNVLADHLNDPSFIPLGDLWNMAAEVGLEFSANVPAYTVRKAVANWAHVSQNRGTVAGLRSEIQLRTGWDADVQVGKNMVLQNDQAQFLAPIFTPFEQSQVYHVNDCIWWPFYGIQPFPFNFNNLWLGDGFWYRCLVEGTYGIEPPGNGTSNANWECVRDMDDFTQTLQNPVTSAPSTWELLDSSAANGTPVQGALTQGLGVASPVQEASNYDAWNSLRCYNRQGSARNLWCRSVSRATSTLGQIPDSSFESGLATPTAQSTWTSFDLDWMPSIWPRILFQPFADWLNVPQWWSMTNATLTRSETEAHTGIWSALLAPNVAVLPQAVTGELTDPGFEAGVVGWTYEGCDFIQDANTSHSGNYSGMIVPDAIPGPSITSPQVAATAGGTYTEGIWVYSAISDITINVTLVFYDDNGDTLDSIRSGNQIISQTVWTHETVSGTAPENTAAMALVLNYIGTPAVTDIFYVDDVTFTGPPAGVVGPNAMQASSPWAICPASTGVTGTIYVYAPAALSTGVQAEVEFWSAYGQSLATQPGSVTVASVGSWVAVTASATSPASTAYVSVNIGMQTALGTDQFYVDDVAVAQGLSLNSNWPPDKINAIRDGIPVPFTRPSMEWDATIRYGTNDTVVYGNQPFIALRASTGIYPPTNCVANNEWAPLSQSPRERVMVSGYTSQNLTNATNYSAEVVPFVEWFDQQGNYIARVFSRNPDSGAEARPDQLAFDSFTTQSLSGNGIAAGTVTISPWVASYYNNTTLTGTPVISQPVPAVNFNWAGQPPAPGVNASGWSASFVGTFTATTSGAYVFSLQAQGSDRMFVNGAQVINNWVSPTTGVLTASVTLAAGTTVTVEIDYADMNDPTLVPPGPPNLISEWFPGSVDGTTAESPVFEVVPGSPFNVELLAGFAYELDVHGASYATLGSPVTAELTIAWFGINGQTIATSVSSVGLGQSGDAYDNNQYVNADQELLTLQGEVPGGAIAAQAFVVFVQPYEYGRLYGPASYNLANVLFELGGNASTISSLELDSITSPASGPSAITVSSSLAGRYTDDDMHTWAVTEGAFTCGGFDQGTTWPNNSATRSVAYLTGVATGMLGVTFRTLPGSGMHQGLMFRHSDDNNYWRATTTALQKKVAGVVTTLVTYTTPFLAGDRMNVEMNGTTITVFRNNVQVAQVTDSFNSTAIQHGIVNE